MLLASARLPLILLSEFLPFLVASETMPLMQVRMLLLKTKTLLATLLATRLATLQILVITFFLTVISYSAAEAVELLCILPSVS